jgi:hypothetical protein
VVGDLILGIIVLVRMRGRGADRRDAPPPVEAAAFFILKKRYAWGEID